MKRISTVIVAFLVSNSVLAQEINIEALSQNIARAIQIKSPLLSSSQKNEITQKLKEISRILGKGADVPNPPNTPGSGPAYSCVSRDSDNKNPWVIGFREGLSVVRSNSVFSSLDDCKSTLSNVRRLGGQTMICVSRDNDGREPFVLASLQGAYVQRYTKNVLSKQVCNDTLASLRADSYEQIVFCISRDSDNRAPFLVTSMSLFTGDSKNGSESFQTLEACKAFVGF